MFESTALSLSKNCEGGYLWVAETHASLLLLVVGCYVNNRVFNPRLVDCRFFDHRSKNLSLAHNGEYIFGGGINILKSFNLRN